ncbi:retrovirus-related pol polyprotein from transposon TNT 1-94, partial [Tanacetum coccineum]
SKKPEQSSSIADPLAYLATHHHTSTQPTTSPTLPSQPPAQSSNDVMLATMNQIVNLLSGFQKQFPLTNNQLRTSSNSGTYATVHDGKIITEPVQRRAPVNVGNTGNRGTQSYGQMTDNKGKKVICYNCCGEGHVARQCKEKKRVKDSQYFKDKMLLMEAKEKGAVLDAEAEAFLTDVECTTPYDQPLAMTTTNVFEVSHEDAYDSDVDEGPNAAAAFMANLSSINSASTSQFNEEKHLDSDVELDIVDNTIPYHKYQLDSEVQDVPTEVFSVPPGEISMITILDDLRTQLDGHLKVNQEQSLVNDSLRAELARCKQEMVSLECNKVKHDLDQTIIQCNKRNAELEEENVLLKSKLSQNVESINYLKNESKKVVSEKKVHEDKYLEEIVCLKSANKVVIEILQRFQQPTQTFPMLTKRPNLATHDLHKTALGSSNPWNLKQAKLSQPTLYDGHALLNPTHTSVKVHDSEDSLVHAEVSRTKMSKRLGTIKPINYAELNALYSHFVPQKELSREQVYWLPAEELATQISNPPKPVTPFVRTRPAKSQISTCLRGLNSWIPAFAHVIDQRTDPCRYPSGSGEFKPVKAMFTEQIIPFYENVKQLVQKLNENIVTEVTEYMRIFDELDTEYERCVLANKNLNIERKNLLIQNDCLIANSLEKDICSIMLASDIVVPPSSNCLCEELRSNCDREHSKVVELEAEILKKQQMLNESEKRCAFIEKNHVNLQVKFQKYKECLQNQRVCDNTNSTASNAIFEINKLKDQLQGKDDTIRNLQTQINITRMLNVGSTVVRIQNDGFKVENENVKRRYKELSETNTHSRDELTGKITALTAENAKLKTELISKISSGSIACEKPKVLAPGMYAISPKYIPPQRRVNRAVPTPLPKKQQVTFKKPPRTSNRPTQKPPVQQNKKPNVPVNLSTRTKPATESRKPMPKSHTRNHRILPSKSVNARRAADHNRKLNVVDHNQFVIRSLKNHNVNTTKTAWRSTGKVVGCVKPQWKPTGRHFALYDNCPLTRIMEPIVEPLELTPSVSSSSKVTMISRFTDCKLRDRKAGSKGISAQGETIHDYYVRFAKLINDMRNIKMTMSRMQLNSKFVNNMLPEWGRFVTAVKLNRGLRDSNYDQLNQATVQDGRVVVSNVQGRQNRGQGNNAQGAGTAGYEGAQNRVENANPDKMLLMQAQENGVALDEEQLLFLVGGHGNAVDEDVDEQPVQIFSNSMLIMFIKPDDYPVYDEVSPSYDSDILSEVHDHDQYQDAVCEHHEEHEMHDDEQVELYERRARFELTEREQKIDEQLRIVITDHNIKEENLKKELHSVKLQLTSTVNHNKSMVKEVTSLKKDFKQKENKYFEEFLDMKALKEKVEDKLYKQDQSLQTVHMLCKPKPYYNELNKVAIGYKNPLCLTRAKQAQSALYNGHEIIKTNHVSAIVHNSEDTIEIAEITRKKMNDKMKDPECVQKKVKITPPDYLKEIYLATFTPQKQLTLEQIFWSQDLIKMKAEAIKTQATASRPIKALMVYPPNTPATLVPRVLPTKSQVKINIFALIQLFSDFEKTCNKRITPTGLTEGERDFKQTKACYLTELEAEVDQNGVDRKHKEIEWKNLLIAIDNLIADCLSKEVFYVATNSELNVSSFTKMHDAHTSLKARCLELEVKLSNLRDKIQKDNHDELIKRFSNLEVNHLNLQLKYQNLKESFGNNTSPLTRDVPNFNSVFVIEKMKASIQGKDNAIKKLRMRISQLNETRSEANCTRDFRTLDF